MVHPFLSGRWFSAMLKTAYMVAPLSILLNHSVISLRQRTRRASHLAASRLHVVLQTAAIRGHREHP